MQQDMPKEQVERISGAVFLIGLGIIALLNYWWPGIMFVVGAMLITRSLISKERTDNLIGAVVVIAIGVAFALPDLFGALGNLWPLLLILAGLGLLFGRGALAGGKRKNEE